MIFPIQVAISWDMPDIHRDPLTQRLPRCRSVPWPPRRSHSPSVRRPWHSTRRRLRFLPLVLESFRSLHHWFTTLKSIFSLFELTTHIKSSNFRPFQLQPRIAAQVFAWHNLQHLAEALATWSSGDEAKPELVLSHPGSGRGTSRPHSAYLHSAWAQTFSAMGSSHFSRENQLDS